MLRPCKFFRFDLHVVVTLSNEDVKNKLKKKNSFVWSASLKLGKFYWNF